MAFLKPHSQPWVLLSKSDHNCHVHGKLNSLKWYCCLWIMEILPSLTESTGWSWLLWMYQTNSIGSTRHQRLKLGCGQQSSKLSRSSEISPPTCVLIINCLPQTVLATICHLVVYLILNSSGKTRCFQAILSRRHRWADLQWLFTIGSLR